MKIIVLNLIIFIIIFTIYKIIFHKYKKNNNKYPVEVMILINFYKININKVNYNKLLNILAFVSSLDITLLVFIVSFINSGIIQIIAMMLLVLPIILISYYIISLFYIKNSSEKGAKHEKKLSGKDGIS